MCIRDRSIVGRAARTGGFRPRRRGGVARPRPGPNPASTCRRAVASWVSMKKGDDLMDATHRATLVVPSPVGPLTLTAEEGVLVAIDFGAPADCADAAYADP